MKKRLIKIISSVLLFFSTVSFATNSISKKTSKENVHEIPKEVVHQVVILGGGVGALTSGVYLARAGFSPVIIEGSMPGGLITQSHLVENWPGEYQITGADLAEKLKSQALQNGCNILNKEVVDIDFSKKPYVITVKDLYKNNQVEKIYADTCIIAMGTSSNYLNVEGEKKYWGKGISNCAVCDGALYKNKNLAIVGGGDAAVEEANYLSNIANKVTVLVRKNELKANDKSKVKSMLQKKNVEVLFNTNVVSINGSGESLESITLYDNEKKLKTNLDIAGVFLAIGSKPNTQMFKNKLDLDEKGYIKIDNNLQTSVKDVYAIGDIVDPVFKQAITAAADGAKAAMLIQKKINAHPKTEFSKPSIDNKNKNIAANEKISKVPEQAFSDSVIEVKDLNQFESEMNSKNIPIIIDFYASWCGPCKRLSPILESQAQILQGKVKILKINVDKLQDVASKYQIKAMPTIVVFDKNRNMLFKKMGTENIFSLLDSLEKIKDKSITEIEDYLQKIK